MPRIILNGEERFVDAGRTILDAARRSGVEIPTLCHDERLAPKGSCRLCTVEVEGEAHGLIACREPVRDGMRIRTHTEDLVQFRRQILEWMAMRVRPESCASEPDKELHKLLLKDGIPPRGTGRKPARDLSHPLIAVDMSQCIDCFRCVQICEDVQGQSVWHVLDRGGDIRVVPDSGSTLGASSCVGCGACVDTCPTSALTDRGEANGSEIETWTRTTCVYCGVGCELEIGTAEDRVVRARPVLAAPVSKGHLCVKGRYAFGFNHDADRVSEPLLRVGSKWRQASWDEALEAAAQGFEAIRSRYGADAIGVLGSARATNEENYLAQKFARVVLGTNNVDCCARVCHTPSAAALKTMLGTGAGTNSFDDIELAHAFLVFGANPLECHPVVGARIRQQVLKHAAKLVVVDPRATELARIADVHLAPNPGTNIPLLNAIANVIVVEGLADESFIRTRVDAWEPFRTFVAAWPAERAAEICGVAPDDIRRAARIYAAGTPAMAFHGLGLTEHIQGTEGVMALVNLALITGNLGKPGSGINPLRGQNNVQGSAQMGCDPASLTGSVAIEDGRALFERVWGVAIPRGRGLDAVTMMDAAAAGRLKALYVIGYDILPTLANMPATKKALRNLELVVVQDLFLTETAELAGHIFLPAASVFEKDGTFMNAERRVQRVRRALKPRGQSRPDWEIISELAKRMGHGDGFRYSNAEAIWNEVREVWPGAAGISYARIEQSGLQWPCRDERDPGTTILHAATFARAPRAALQKIEYLPSPERCSPDYPFLLSTGRNLYQFNAGTMTMRSSTKRLRPTDSIDLSPADAEALGVANGTVVSVRSRHGQVSMRARILPSVRQGHAFATFHDPRVGLNKVTSPNRDRIVGSPEYKLTAVSISPAPVRARPVQADRLAP